MKDKRIRYEDIEYAIVDNGRLYVLGEIFHPILRNTYFDIVCNASTGEIFEENIFKFDTAEEAKIQLQKEIKQNDLILIDGSSEMKMGEIVEEIKT